MKKFLKITIIVILVLANAAAVVIAATRPQKYGIYRVNADGKPLIGEKLDLQIPADETAKKQFAYNLYMTANNNFKKLDKAAYYVNSVTTTLDIPVVGYRYFVKNADALLYLEYSFVLDPIQAFLLGFGGKENVQFAERCYTDKSMDYMYAEKTLEPTFSITDGNILYEANWGDLYYTKQKPKPIYYAEQEGVFEYTDQTITPETIKTVQITYNDQEGYYRLELDLDVANPATTAKTLPNLRENSGAPDARYNSMKEIIEIWDNGYFKYFLSEDNWSGKRGIMNLSSNIRFETDFLYNDEALSFSSYQYSFNV